MSRPRRGNRVAFAPQPDRVVAAKNTVTGLRFVLKAQVSGEVLIDFRDLRPRRLALACAKALYALAAPGGPLTVRTTIKAYALTIRKFFDYLGRLDDRVTGPEDLRATHIDGFEEWMEAEGLTRIHLFTILTKVVATLRQTAAIGDYVICSDLAERLRYVSAKAYERSHPRDAYSPYVAQQLRDAARADTEQIFRRIGSEETIADSDASLRRATEAVQAIVNQHGVIGYDHRAYKSLFFIRMRRDLPVSTLIDDLHGRRYLLRTDILPLLVLLSLETGLEIECCKSLTIECLRNSSAGTVEVTYLKRRARGAEHKSLRVRDGGLGTPGGLIRRLIEVTATARHFCPSDSLWIYFCTGRLRAGIDHPDPKAWTARHNIVDDAGKRLGLTLSRLRKTHKALWYQKTEGHIARFAVGHTPEVAARHYADIPSLKPLHEATIADALHEAVKAAHTPIVLTPREEASWRRYPHRAEVVEPKVVGPFLDGKQDVWLASCRNFYASPFGKPDAPCPQPFWGCLDCGNAVITARKLPAILGFLTFVETQRQSLSPGDWQAKFGHVHWSITNNILPRFSRKVVEAARRAMLLSPPKLYLPPEIKA